VVRLISALLADSVERARSDIHFEPEQNFLRTYASTACCARSLAAQDLLAGDGRAHQGDGENEHCRDPCTAGRPHLRTMSGRVVDFRVASLRPATARTWCADPRPAERIVPLDKLGLEEGSSSSQAHDRPAGGIVLVTGPTGSGKTHTPSSIPQPIQLLTASRDDLEDPVEYPMTSSQTSVSSGEARLRERLRAMNAAGSDVSWSAESRPTRRARWRSAPRCGGHQVYTTLHTTRGGRFRGCSNRHRARHLAGNIIGSWRSAW